MSPATPRQYGLLLAAPQPELQRHRQLRGAAGRARPLPQRLHLAAVHRSLAPAVPRGARGLAPVPEPRLLQQHRLPPAAAAGGAAAEAAARAGE